MDATRFNWIARAIGGGATRRTTLGLSAAGLLGALGLDESNAKKGKRKKCKKCGPCEKCKKGKCKPKREGTPCGSGKQCFGNGKCLACDVCASGCPHATLTAALAAASDGATIHVCTGIYPTNAVISQDVTVIGAGAGPGGTVLDGGGAGRVIQVQGVTVALRTLRLTGGNGIDGGGIHNDEGTLTLSACVVSENVADSNGGGIHNDRGTLILTDCVVSTNRCDANGAGVYNFGTLTVTGGTFSENEAGSNGGGFYNFGAEGTVTLTKSDVSENTAGNGGGFYNFGDTVTLIDSKLTGNDATGRGGGIFNRSAKVTLDAPSRVTGNTAGDTGGGIYINDASGSVALASAANVSGNTPNNCTGVAAIPLCAG